MPLAEQPPVVGRGVVDGRWERALGGEMVLWDQGAGPCGVGEMAGELAPRVGRGDHVAAAIEVHEIADSPSQERGVAHRPPTAGASSKRTPSGSEVMSSACSPASRWCGRSISTAFGALRSNSLSLS